MMSRTSMRFAPWILTALALCIVPAPPATAGGGGEQDGDDELVNPSQYQLDVPGTVVSVEKLDASGSTLSLAAPVSFHELRLTTTASGVETRVLRSQGKRYSVTHGSGFCFIVPAGTASPSSVANVTITQDPSTKSTVVAASALTDDFCGFAWTYGVRFDPQTGRCGMPDPNEQCLITYTGEQCTSPAPQFNIVTSGDDESDEGLPPTNPDDWWNIPWCDFDGDGIEDGPCWEPPNNPY
jgi:hypothetical protein